MVKRKPFVKVIRRVTLKSIHNLHHGYKVESHFNSFISKLIAPYCFPKALNPKISYVLYVKIQSNYKLKSIPYIIYLARAIQYYKIDYKLNQ